MPLNDSKISDIKLMSLFLVKTLPCCGAIALIFNFFIFVIAYLSDFSQGITPL